MTHRAGRSAAGRQQLDLARARSVYPFAGPEALASPSIRFRLDLWSKVTGAGISSAVDGWGASPWKQKCPTRSSPDKPASR